ncbi:hypothetical protein ASPSYDRAFT_85221 [Aspergillus sydowii CBS 593.65]|uniref:Uncharacterized protein n=1 Tax=Aspergillus sydowii CBS 593.65 TaxID=1036612 RepID=A0A1L9U0M9_9EURO|nr:uncharacterized protein ASPSYDRAFT_85221 [Aspergillus sydowii CBS 593.65]OJJ65247.1 hypothetical protein ASPSYDRAFT_85221 [Aspergillus sydowii CBS 593.65]
MASNERTRTLFAIQTRDTSAQTLSAEQFQQLVSAGQVHVGHIRGGGTLLSTDRINWVPLRRITVDEANVANNVPDVNEDTTEAEDPEEPEAPEDPGEADETDETDDSNEFDETDEMDETENSDGDEDDVPQRLPTFEEAQQYMRGQPISSPEDLVARALTIFEAVNANDSGIEGAMAEPDGEDSEDEAPSASTESEDDFVEKSQWDDWDREPETKFWQRDKDTGVRPSLGFR